MLFTRFAPSPTGYLHEGHLLSALYVFSFAKYFGAQVKLRIENHDKSRARKEYIQNIREILQTFGFHFISESIQSENEERYHRFFDKLQSEGKIYRCNCSRKKLAEENPENEDGEIIYQGFCKTHPPKKEEQTAFRYALPDKKIVWEDLLHGHFEEMPVKKCGDMIIKDRLGQWSYQFAAAADDFEEDIGLIVRGEDLLSSSSRQILLAENLGRKTRPIFLHHPLLFDDSGKKLSKRFRSESLQEMLSQGHSVKTILGKTCLDANLISTQTPLSLEESTELILQKTIPKLKRELLFRCFPPRKKNQLNF